jgi:hypothetical protein
LSTAWISSHAADGVLVGRHVRHRAPRAQVGQDDLDRFGGEHVGGLGHEVHAAEDDELDGLLVRDARRELAELERVAPQVGVPDDLVLLVVVPQDHEAIAQAPAPVGDLRRELAVGQFSIDLGERGLPQLHQGSTSGVPVRPTLGARRAQLGRRTAYSGF